MNDALFMKRCLRLAKKGLGYTYPNPLVGCVIVHGGKIIAEGWHKKAGRDHAEREAILKVKNPSLLSESTLYVNLEPCDHHGKTPPCSDLIVEMKIPRVIIGCLDQNKKVLGKGLKKLQAAGCEVITGVLESDCQKLNRRFFCFHHKKRPYTILKWAESADGFIAPLKSEKPYWLTDPLSKQRIHQWRSQEQCVMVGVQTVLNDNSKLNTRLWEGNHPLPVVIDPNQRLFQSKKKLHLPKKKILTITNFSEGNKKDKKTIKPIEILSKLYQKNMQSVIIEGGAKTLQHFIDAQLWDETRIFITKDVLNCGLEAPKIKKDSIYASTLIKKDTLITLYKD